MIQSMKFNNQSVKRLRIDITGPTVHGMLLIITFHVCLIRSPSCDRVAASVVRTSAAIWNQSVESGGSST